MRMFLIQIAYSQLIPTVEFLRTIFYKTHNKLLLNYDKLASLDQTIEKGTYGCLTGTMLYALILDHFKIAYEIIELPNHVFLQIRAVLDNEEVFFAQLMSWKCFTNPYVA